LSFKELMAQNTLADLRAILRHNTEKGEQLMKRNVIRIWIAVLCAALVCASCGEPPRNPMLNTVITAHGNTDWHIDTAEEFLTGLDMDGTDLATNHMPNTWTGRHIHVGMANTRDYYYDSSKVASGADSDVVHGIDRAMLFFYAGHGNPDIWNTLGNSASQDDVLLANNAGDGLLRYYWQCSCEVFAHGALTCPGSSDVYSCPATFDGSADSVNMRNVYERWGPALTADLRMACGSSTLAWCWHGEVDAIWDNYNNHHYYVSDAFVFGLTRYHSNVVPLCITMGGADVIETPLWDLTFTNEPNTSGTTRYHIQYLSNFESTPRFVLIPTIVAELPVLELIPLPLSDSLSEIEFKQDGDWLLSPQEVRDRGPATRVNASSGAVYALGETGGFAEGKALSEEEYLHRAMSYLKEQGWQEEFVAEPMGVSIRIQSVPVEGNAGDIQDMQKSVLITFKRMIQVGGKTVNVLGPGGVMTVQLNNDGSVLNASKVWRTVAKEGEMRPVKPREQALEEAIKQIENPDAYKLDSWNWGYKEFAGNVEQKEMKVVYQFQFVPAEQEQILDYPPVTVEIAAQE
jgi:hypothetical protein